MDFRSGELRMNPDIKRFVLPVVVALVSSFVLFVLRSFSFGLLRRWSEKSEEKIGAIVIDTFRTPSFYLCIAIGLHSGLSTSELPARYVFYLTKVIHVVVIFSITYACANLSGDIFRNYIQKSNLPIPPTGLAYGIVKGAVFAVGFLIILGALGIAIAPLLTALGVGGLAVALALKDSLENLFAGIHILMERSVRIGDLIRLETGQEGRVEDITWRTTRIRVLSNNMVIIPNSKLAQSIVTNYYLPDKTIFIGIAVAVGYESDVEKAEKAIAEEARKAVGEVAGLLGEPEPSVTMTSGYKEGAIEFTVGCNVSEYTEQYSVQDELRRRILKRLRDEGIAVPLPARAVYIKKDI